MPIPSPTAPYNNTGTYCGPRLLTEEFTTSAGGAATVTFTGVNGYLHAVQLVGAGDYNLAAGTDVTLKIADFASNTGLSLWVEANVGNAYVSRFPRQVVHKSTDGSALTFYDRHYLIDDTVELVVTNGGNATTGLIALLLVDR